VAQLEKENVMEKISETANASFASGHIDSTIEFPTPRYIEIGAGSTASFAADSHGINSGAHNKSAAQLLACFEAEEEAILKAATSDIKGLLENKIS
jgi:hypothetical protein